MQITAYKDSRHIGEVTRDLKGFRYDGEAVINFSEANDRPGSMSMYDYDLSRVFAQFALPPDARVVMEKTDHGGCHGFFIFLRKV